MSIYFGKKQYFDIVQINFDNVLKHGTCKLVNKHCSYKMIWSVRNYPMEKPNMPGSPFPVLVNYTIFDNKSSHCINGEFVYELSSGTLPYLSELGIPYNNYKSYNYLLNLQLNLKLKKDCLELCIKPLKRHSPH